MKSLTLSLLAVLLACTFAEAQTYAVADSLFAIATQAEEAGDWATAAEYYEKSVAAEKECEVPREDDLYVLNSKASTVYEKLNNLDKAMEFRKESYWLAKKIFDENSVQAGTESQALGSLYDQMGFYSDALPFYLEAIDIAKETLGKEHSDYAVRLDKLAMLYYQMGQYDRALLMFQEALEITEKKLGKDHSKYGIQLNNLALIHEIMGLYEAALPLYLEALEIIENSLGKEHMEYGNALNNLGYLYYSMGQYDKALPVYLETLENTELTLGKEHSDYGLSLSNLALLYKSMGQYEKAMPLYLDALEITEKTLGKDHAQYGIYLNNLALLYKTTGQFEKALPLHLEALDNTEKSLGKEHPEYGIRVGNLAVCYEAMGEYNKALPLHIEAMQTLEKSLGKAHPAYGNSLSYLAGFYRRTNQYDKALPLYQEALENTEKSLGKEHAHYGIRLDNLAGLYMSMGEFDNALPMCLQGMENFYFQFNQSFNFLSENEKEQFQRTVSIQFESYRSFFLNYSVKKPVVAAHAFDIELALKGMILESGMHMRDAIQGSGDSTALAAYEHWEEQRRELSQEYSKPIAMRRDDLSTLEAETEKNEAELTRMSGAFKEAAAVGDARWTDVQASLRADEVAIEFASFRYQSKTSTDSVLYVANVLRSTDAHPHMVYLCEQAQLDSIFELADVSNSQFVSSLYRGASPVKGLASDQTKGARLYKLIWAPLEAYLTPGSQVYYAPSGTLHQVAFAALPTGGDSLLMDRHALVQLSSTAQLIRQGDEKQGAPASMALFGGISYELEQEDLLASAATFQSDQYTSRSLPDDLVRGDNWNYLPGTLKEVEAIHDIAEKRAVQTTLFTGDKAVEESFKSLGGAQSPDVLHISTHGFFFPDPQREQSDAFSESKTVFRASDNPLLRSGLLFAGANRAWRGEALPEGVDDGILTAYEVSHLYLGNTRLVVLSACETGLGDIKGSEGVFGLQRAFKAAGADYLMMSLWKVPDAETAQFMTHFYESWFAGADIATAFHDTQQAMRSKYPDDPYKWAAFVLVR